MTFQCFTEKTIPNSTLNIFHIGVSTQAMAFQCFTEKCWHLLCNSCLLSNYLCPSKSRGGQVSLLTSNFSRRIFCIYTWKKKIMPLWLCVSAWHRKSSQNSGCLLHTFHTVSRRMGEMKKTESPVCQLIHASTEQSQSCCRVSWRLTIDPSAQGTG